VRSGILSVWPIRPSTGYVRVCRKAKTISVGVPQGQ
jgi:hypothetical protein